MARVRLTSGMRSRLNDLAGKTVEPKKERRALDAAYAKAEPLVRKIVEAMFPPREMRILQKYKAADFNKDVKIAFPNGEVDCFTFQPEREPLIPSGYDWRNQIYLADAPAAAAIDAWLDALKAYTAERKTRLAAYYALIAGSTFLDEITAIWIALVKSDVRERKAA